MNLLRNIRPFPVASRSRDGIPYEHMNPRIAAIRLLREKIADRKAGLDPYDERVFLVDAHATERLAVERSLERTGHILDHRLHGAGVRFRAIIEADARAELGLDGPGAPTLDDEPLASRGVTETIHRHIDALAAPETQVRVLTLVDGRLEDENEDASPVLRAIDEAKAAYDRRHPAGVVFDQEVH